MEIHIKELYWVRPSMALASIDMPMAIFMKANGKMINSKGVGCSNLQMDPFMKESSAKVNPKAKEFTITSHYNMMTSNSTVDHGKHHNRMDLEKQFIIMEMYMKARS